MITAVHLVRQSSIQAAFRTSVEISKHPLMIQEYYRQMRNFGCNILAVVQQYDVIKDSPVRGAMIGNSKMFLKLNSGRLPGILSPAAKVCVQYPVVPLHYDLSICLSFVIFFS